MAHIGSATAELGQGHLRAPGQLAEQLLVQREQAHVDLTGLLEATLDGGHAHLVHQPWRHVGGDADVSMAAQQHQRDGGAIVARESRSPFGACLTNRAARSMLPVASLTPTTPGTCARRSVVWQHVGHGAARHVVQHHRQVHCLGHRLEVLVDAFLGRLVVVGNDLQAAIGADRFGEPA